MERLMVAGAKWAVEIADGVEGFEADWRSLASSSNSTPFQNYDVMRVFYTRLAAAQGHQPVIACVRYTDGRPAAIFPMTRTRQHGLNWLQTEARPLDYCAPVFDSALPAEAIGEIIGATLAAVPNVDLLYVNRIPQQFAAGPSPLVTMANAGRLRLSSWQLPLVNTDLAARLQKRLRNELKSRTRQLGEKHDRQFQIAFGADVDPATFAAFKSLRSESFTEKGRSDILGDPLWGELYQGLLDAEGDHRAWLATLRADGEIIAALYGIFVGGRVQVILPASLTGDWKSYRPGLQLFQETMLYFQNEGFELFDLSIGDMTYKSRLGSDKLGLYDAMFPKSVVGYAYYALWRLKVTIRSKMKAIADD